MYRLLQSPAHCEQLLMASPSLFLRPPSLSPSPSSLPSSSPSHLATPSLLFTLSSSDPSRESPVSPEKPLHQSFHLSLPPPTSPSFSPSLPPRLWTASHPKTRDRLKQKRKSPCLVSLPAPPSFLQQPSAPNRPLPSLSTQSFPVRSSNPVIWRARR